MASRHSSALVVFLVGVLVLAPAAAVVPVAASQASTGASASLTADSTPGAGSAFGVASDDASTGPSSSGFGWRVHADDDESDDEDESDDDEERQNWVDDDNDADNEDAGDDDANNERRDDVDDEYDEFEDGWWGDHDENDDDDENWFWWLSDDDEDEAESDKRPMQNQKPENPGRGDERRRGGGENPGQRNGDEPDEQNGQPTDERPQDSDSQDGTGDLETVDSSQNTGDNRQRTTDAESTDKSRNTDNNTEGDAGTPQNGADSSSGSAETSAGTTSEATTEESASETMSTVSSIQVEPNISRATVRFVSVPEVVGQPLVVEATTTNTGNEPGRKVVQFEVEHEIVENRSFVLAPGETRTVTFEYRFETPGNKTIEVDAGRNRFVTVEPRHPELAVTELRASQTEFTVGDPVTFTAIVTNRGTAAGNVPLRLELFGEVVAVRNVSIPPGETRAVEFSRVIRAPGTYEAVVGNTSVTLSVSGTSTTTSEDRNTETAFGSAGFGPVVTLLAFVLALGTVFWRRR